MIKYKKYAEGVVSGNTVACRYIKLACSRYLSWFDRDDIEFRTDKADYVVNFLQHLEHFQGKFAGRKLILEEWQKFFIYGIYGWYYKGTDDRVVKHVILDCGRKQGKSMIGAGMALYHLIGEKESGAECDIVANSRQQAKILFDMCDAISKRMDQKRKYLKQTINRVKFPKTYCTMFYIIYMKIHNIFKIFIRKFCVRNINKNLHKAPLLNTCLSLIESYQ